MGKLDFPIITSAADDDDLLVNPSGGGGDGGVFVAVRSRQSNRAGRQDLRLLSLYFGAGASLGGCATRSLSRYLFVLVILPRLPTIWWNNRCNKTYLFTTTSQIS